MTRENNIFYRLTKENENTTTELLCNLLRTKYIRNICLRYFDISEEIIENISIENISTQKSFDKEGILDIIIQNKDSYYIIGIKFWEIGRQIMEIQGNNPLKIMCRPLWTCYFHNLCVIL